MPGPTASDRTASLIVRVSPEFRDLLLQCARRVHGITSSEYVRRLLAEGVERDRKKIPENSKKKG